jgi:hypothetical protein
MSFNTAVSVMDAKSLFRDKGLSDRTIKALLDCGIDAPERLLFMTPDQLAVIRGVGKISLGEIMRYRARFITTDGAMLNWLSTPTCRLIYDGAPRRPAL